MYHSHEIFSYERVKGKIMKNKFLKLTLAGLTMSVCCLANVANAGLINGNTEWLDLSLTNNLNYSELSTLLSNSEYSGYSLATLSQVNSLFSPVLNDISQGSTVDGYYDVSHVTSQPTLDVFAWIREGRAQATGYGAATTVNTNYFFETNMTYAQQLSFGSLVNKPCEGFERDFGICDPNDPEQGRLTGSFNMNNDKNDATKDIYFRHENNSAYTLAGATSYVLGDDENLQSRSWLVTRAFNGSDGVASVPEPSTLAIFALGMIGLASRRFKKQS